MLTMTRRGKKERPVRTITVASGKGGVGKSTVVANLAVTLQKMGNQVLVFDADLGLSNIDVILDLAPRYTIQHVLSGEKSLRDIIVEGPHGIKVLPAASGVQELTGLDEFQSLRLLEEFDNLGMDLDFLIVDSAAGISSNVAFFCVASEQIVVVTSPEPTALTDAYALMKVLASAYQERHFEIIVNSARDEAEGKEVFGRLSAAGERFLNISLDYLGSIAQDDAVRKAVREQVALVDEYPASRAALNLTEIAHRLNEERESRVKGSLQFFLGSLIGRGV
jgi:flagellar biosynthesis protein FlhG